MKSEILIYTIYTCIKNTRYLGINLVKEVQEIDPERHILIQAMRGENNKQILKLKFESRHLNIRN